MQPLQNTATKPNESTRRASASAMSARRPPLPSSMSNRSQSLDELLDTSESNVNDGALATERASEDENTKTESDHSPDTDANSPEDRLGHTTGSNDPPRRPSRSDRAKSVGVDAEQCSEKKGELENRLNCSETNSIGSTSSLNVKINPTPSPHTDTTSNINQDDTKSCSTTYSQPDSMGSQSSDKKGNFVNRYVKKVKSLMKK